MTTQLASTGSGIGIGIEHGALAEVRPERNDAGDARRLRLGVDQCAERAGATMSA